MKVMYKSILDLRFMNIMENELQGDRSCTLCAVMGHLTSEMQHKL